MSTYAIPVVSPVVDGFVNVLEDNFLFKLPFIGGLLKQAVELCLVAAAFFAVALTLGGALFYGWPSVAGLLPHWLGTLGGGYWAYVVVVLGLYAVRITYINVMARTRADVLHKDGRDKALGMLTEPALLVMLIWLVTTYIS